MGHNPKINGSNSATGTGNDKMAKIILQLLSCSTVVEQLSHTLKINGSNPATGTGNEKMANIIDLCHRCMHQRESSCCPVAQLWNK